MTGMFSAAERFRPSEALLAAASQPGPAAGGGGNGAARDVRIYGPAEDDSDPSPVVPLGKAGDVLVVMSPGGEVLTWTAKLNAQGMILAFDGNADWLIRNFNRLDKDGEPTRDFNLRNAFAWFVARCRRAGIWDPATSQRRIGVWRGPADPSGRARPVCHCGDRIWLAAASQPAPLARGEGAEDSGWKEPGWRHGATLYVAAPAIPEPDLDRPATVGDCRRLLDALDLWTFQTPAAVELLGGWLMAALLGGFPSWRVHVQISAEFGAGKSTLLNLLKSALGAMSSDFNDVSEAFLRASFANQSRVGVLDEQEQEGGIEGKMARLIALLRKMAGDEGAKVGRGSSDQQAHQVTVSGCVLMAGILPPPLQPADKSRILRLELKKATGGDAGKLALLEREIAWARSISAALRGRALTMWQMFDDCRRMYRAAVIDAAGGDGRQADLLATLLAGRELMLRDRMPTDDDRDEAVDLIRPMLAGMKETDQESSTAQLCWNHLLSYDTPDRRGGEIQNIGNMIAYARAEEDFAGPYGRTLPRFGLRLIRVTPDLAKKEPHLRAGREYLLIANNAGGLHRIFSGAIGGRWAGGNWTLSLKQLGDDVITWPRPENFAGIKSRALAIPAAGPGEVDPYLPPPMAAPHPDYQQERRSHAAQEEFL